MVNILGVQSARFSSVGGDLYGGQSIDNTFSQQVQRLNKKKQQGAQSNDPRSADKFSSVLANQHMRFIPKHKLNFDYLSGDGPLSLIFEASEDS